MGNGLQEQQSCNPDKIFHRENVFCSSQQCIMLVSLLSQVEISLVALLHLARSIILLQRMSYSDSLGLLTTSKFSSD